MGCAEGAVAEPWDVVVRRTKRLFRPWEARVKGKGASQHESPCFRGKTYDEVMGKVLYYCLNHMDAEEEPMVIVNKVVNGHTWDGQEL